MSQQMVETFSRSKHMTQLSFETLSRVDEYNITMANKLRASAEKLRERASTINTEINGNVLAS